jgi:hypothetical protein
MVAGDSPRGSPWNGCRFATMQNHDPNQSPAAKVALAFATRLVAGDFAAAHRLLAPELRDDMQPGDLKYHYTQMTVYWDAPADTIEVASIDGDWAFVSIDSRPPDRGSCLEAVTLRIVEQAGQCLISEIVWGRP